MAPKDSSQASAKDENTNSSKDHDKHFTPRFILQAARYKAALELHGEHVKAHLNQLKEIQERHNLVTDEILPKLGLMGDSLQSRMDLMQKQVDRLHDICLEVERNQAAEEAKPKPAVEEPPPKMMTVSPQVLHDLGLADLSNLVSDEVVKLVYHLAVRGAPIAETSTTSHPTIFSAPMPATTEALTTNPSPHPPLPPPASYSPTHPSAEIPPPPPSPQKTYKERQKERRKQKKAEKAKLQKEKAHEQARPGAYTGRKDMKQKKLAMKKVRKRLRSRAMKEDMMGAYTVKTMGDILHEVGVAICWAPFHVWWMRSLQKYDMETRWRLRTKRYSFYTSSQVFIRGSIAHYSLLRAAHLIRAYEAIQDSQPI
ncbi:hypothetical protein Daesc_006143 [Daldinia eschscholtzii]|uniref:Uncharacterized protein n=1 Tax=Daldinia eschscholtzii TaxID=292717 RepID=A0AAX6MHH4_9PEZI